MRRISYLLAVAAVSGAAVAGTAGASRQSTTLSLVAYSTPREAYKKIIPAFQEIPAGKDVSVTQSYGASGDQARAVLNGLPADVVELSLEPDVTELVKAGIVSKGWNRGAYEGMVTDSVVVFVVRDGNPKHIKSWNDLTKPGIQVITPNPFTSGGARWNVMAAYGAQLKLGKKPAEAQAYLLKLFRNVAVQDKSARDALNTFLGGKGDVLITYENEAILAQKQGQQTPYVIPRSTILIENPVAITNGKNQAQARAFLRFLYTPTAQKLFADTGYRPVVKSVASRYRFPGRPGLFTIGFVGGWNKVQTQFFDPKNSIMAGVERQVGGITG
jgi:sulfate transport system substrate-binding protein